MDSNDYEMEDAVDSPMAPPETSYQILLSMGYGTEPDRTESWAPGYLGHEQVTVTNPTPATSHLSHEQQNVPEDHTAPIFSGHVQQNVLDTESNFSFPAIQPEVKAQPSTSSGGAALVGSFDPYSNLDSASSFSFPVIQPTIPVIAPPASEPGKPTLAGNNVAPVRQDVCFPASPNRLPPTAPRSTRARGARGFDADQNHSPHRRTRALPKKSLKKTGLYPDYYRPDEITWNPELYNEPRDSSPTREVKQLEEACPIERGITALVNRFIDMDIKEAAKDDRPGRDDRYRGSGNRGGNKRRRDGKFESYTSCVLRPSLSTFGCR